MFPNKIFFFPKLYTSSVYLPSKNYGKEGRKREGRKIGREGRAEKGRKKKNEKFHL